MKKPEFNLDLVANISEVGKINTNIEVIKNKALEINLYYKHLVYTENDVDIAKKEKATISKLKSAVADSRKSIVAEWKKPIDSFESSAKETEKILGETYNLINDQVAKFEDTQKQLKSDEVKAFFEEYREALEIGDFVTYEKANINVTLSASMKSLKEEAKKFLDKVDNDIKLINTQENSSAIMVEYEKTLDVSSSIITVKDRIEKERIFKEQEEIRKQAKLEAEAHQQKVEKEIVTAPHEVSATQEDLPTAEPEYTMTFAVTGTLEELRQVKRFLEERGIKYESRK